uniref:Secreted protein n=1 Tax=Leptobrachium leishanense TaxID=445787 RepID=A0A8C5Q2V5_9ANUR
CLSRHLRFFTCLLVTLLQCCLGPFRIGVMRVAASARCMSAGRIPNDAQQTTGLAKAIITEEPHIVPSITDMRIVSCICEEDNTSVICF